MDGLRSDLLRELTTGLRKKERERKGMVWEGRANPHKYKSRLLAWIHI